MYKYVLNRHTGSVNLVPFPNFLLLYYCFRPKIEKIRETLGNKPANLSKSSTVLNWNRHFLCRPIMVPTFLGPELAAAASLDHNKESDARPWLVVLILMSQFSPSRTTNSPLILQVKIAK